jgi:hypothetical protein
MELLSCYLCSNSKLQKKSHTECSYTYDTHTYRTAQISGPVGRVTNLKKHHPNKKFSRQKSPKIATVIVYLFRVFSCVRRQHLLAIELLDAMP